MSAIVSVSPLTSTGLWTEEFLDAGKKRSAGDTAHKASSGEVKTLPTGCKMVCVSQDYGRSVANILNEPVSRNLSSEALRFCLVVYRASN